MWLSSVGRADDVCPSAVTASSRQSLCTNSIIIYCTYLSTTRRREQAVSIALRSPEVEGSRIPQSERCLCGAGDDGEDRMGEE
jgi:hypothetical protein